MAILKLAMRVRGQAPLIVVKALLLVFLFPVAAKAQELTPRVYWPSPNGTNIWSVGYSYVSGDTTPDPTLPVTAVDSDIHTALVGTRHTVSLLGRTANIVFEVPYSDGDTAGEGSAGNAVKMDYQGLGDVHATLAVNLMGAPSLSKEEFAELRRNPHPILGASLKLVAPTGDYDSDKVINVGDNRWAMKAEVGYIQPLKPQWLLELEMGVWFFTDNDNVRGLTREQDPIYALDVHLVRRFSAGFWGSLDASAYRGGRSTLDGQRLDDLQRDTKMGLTLLYPFLGKNAVKFSYSKGSLNDSDEDFDTYLISFQRLF
jgi:hypothetical protein